MRYYTPLRYPGGKGKLLPFFRKLVEETDGRRNIYVEPYAGGAGVALGLLLSERVQRVHINDASRSIYAFWNALLNDTTKFLKLLREVPITVNEWHRQRDIASDPSSLSTEVGFAVFFLNRTNRSGIIQSGGVIGGQEQEGKWKIDARFNREQLADRIRLVASYRRRISLHNQDAVLLLDDLAPEMNESWITYLDPPYYHKADRLYHRTYVHDDHAKLAEYVKRLRCRWVVTYDNCCEIEDLYADLPTHVYELNYTAAQRRAGGEILIHRGDMKVPVSLLPGLSECQ